MIELIATNASAIAAEFVRSRRRSGSPAMGMIMTLVIVADKADAEEALSAARSASREHPARILVVVFGDKRGAGQVDAQVGIGSGASGERAVLRLSGEVTRHAESVVLPLLLPDSPVVVWWPGRAPEGPRVRPVGQARHPTDHGRRVRADREGAGHAGPVPQLRTGQHGPGLDPDHRMARTPCCGARPEPRQGDVRVGDRRADQPQRRPPVRLAR